MLIKGKMIPFTQSNNKTSRSSNRKEKTKNNNAKKQIKRAICLGLSVKNSGKARIMATKLTAG